MSWPLAMMVTAVVLVIGVVAALGRDVESVTSAILFILIALGLAELREIKASTNGNTTNLMRQNEALLAELARQQQTATQLLAASQPVSQAQIAASAAPPPVPLPTLGNDPSVRS